MDIIDKYLRYVRDVRRYSPRTSDIYKYVLRNFEQVMKTGDDIVSFLNPSLIRTYEVKLLDAEVPCSPATVNQHLSVLSSFCRFLIKEGLLKSNPVNLVPKPKVPKNLPRYFRKEAMEEYFRISDIYASEEYLEMLLSDIRDSKVKELYKKRLARLIISMLYGLGLRRAELISLDISSVDFGRKVVKVCGKGDKTREIPIIDALCQEILLYLKAVEALVEGERSLKEPLLITYTGHRLYPAYVDRVVKSELSAEYGFTGRKSPHVLRHSLATELLNGDADLNSIKELLGHSSLAATQVYTHNSIARLKDIYKQAHPRAKNGGKHGD